MSSKPISPNLFGLFFEDINYSADGGLYAELVQNRSFEYGPADRRDWHPFSSWDYVTPGFSYGDVNIASNDPVHINNPHYVILNATHIGHEEKFTGISGVGLKNTGFDGMVIRSGQKYNLSLFARQLSDEPISMVVSVQTPKGRISSESKLSLSSKAWTNYTSTFTAAED